MGTLLDNRQYDVRFQDWFPGAFWRIGILIMVLFLGGFGCAAQGAGMVLFWLSAEALARKVIVAIGDYVKISKKFKQKITGGFAAGGMI
jgi:hypothetical protein